MRLLDKLAKRIGYAPIGKRNFNLASQTRLTSDWISSNADANKELRSSVKLMRERARELEQNNDYIRRYFKLLENNVLGANGIGLQMKITEPARVNGAWITQFDRRANQLIEEAWDKWGRKETCTIFKNLTWVDLQRLALRSVARDGAHLTKHWTVANPYGYSVEPLEIDYLDLDYFQNLGNGNEVKLGIEYNAAGIAQTYHLFSRHPGDAYSSNVLASPRRRIAASEMLHLYYPERFGQATGWPWITSAGTSLRHLGAYFEAEIIASRAAASKMAFLERTGTVEYTGTVDDTGARQMEISPGSVEELPPGMTMKPFDPTHPNSQFGSFVKSALRGISAGLGVSYVSLANDLEGVNYSSIRAGLLDEREEWKAVQRWFIEWFVTPIFETWLKSALTFGAIPLPVAKFDKFNRPEWKPRRWDWVDPLKDQQANVLAVEKGFKSRRAIIAESGGDIEDVFTDIANDEALAEEYDLDFSESDEQANEQQDQPDAPDDTDVDKKGLSDGKTRRKPAP